MSNVKKNYVCALVDVLIKLLYEMHGVTIKMVNAQQTKLKNNYKNTKLKLLKTNAEIWFNKTCKYILHYRHAATAPH